MATALEDLGHRSETVRRVNLRSIVRELHADGPLSRSDLVSRTGLTRSAIRALTGELVAGGLATEGPPALDGTPGRPSPLVRANPLGAVVIGLEIAADSLAAATVGLGGHVFDLERVDLPRGRSSPADIAAELGSLSRELRARLPDDHVLAGVGVGVVGVVRRSDGMVSMAPNLGWRDEPLGRHLAAVFGDEVAITVANDADMATLAEARRGAARGVDDAILVWASIGVGGGLILDGQPFTGAAGYSGEIGHVPVRPDGRSCRCGSSGCLESEVGVPAILRRAGIPPEAGKIGLAALLARAEAGEPEALAAFAETGRWLGVGLAGLVNALNPRLVLFGGLLRPAYPYVRPCLESELDRRALPAARQLVRVLPSSLDLEAPVLGAAELALEPVLNDPATWLRDRPGATRSAISAIA